jgi:hypothetical protein
MQLRGWLRYLGRNLRTVRGALTALLGITFFGLWLTAFFIAPERTRVQPDVLRRDGPAVLLLYCLMNVIISPRERAIYFSPGEVNFLFTGPFGRREILGYKIVLTLLVSIPSTLILAAVVRVHAASFLTAYVTLLLAVLFQQLFGMVVNLVAGSIGARAFTRGRRVLLVAVIIVGAVILLQSAGAPARWRSPGLREAATASPIWQTIATPLRWFFEAFLAERIWPDLIEYASLAMLVNLALLVVVFALDAHYMEASAAASARIYSQIQRFRRGGMAAAGRGGTALFRIPDLPYWGGVGPLLWRQLTTAARGMGRLALVLGLVGLFVVMPLLAQHDEGESRTPAAMLALLVVWLTVFLTQLVPFDFRGDVDRIAALKVLPISAWRLAIGQLLTPVLLVTGAQWATLAAGKVLRPEEGEILLVLAAFAPPFNFLLFALENLLFLRFPMRVMASAPGDFQAVGRNLLFAGAKMAVLTTVGAAAVGLGMAAWLTTRLLLGVASSAMEPEEVQKIAMVVAEAAAWFIVTLSGLALVPFVAGAFKAFDVARDTPA